MSRWICALLCIPMLSFGANQKIKFRSIDGSDNTPGGTVNSPLIRITGINGYADGKSSPNDRNRPSPREVSNLIAAQGDEDVPNDMGASDMVWQWGQFIDHDLDLTEAAKPQEIFDIPVPVGDPFFDPMGKGNVFIPLSRSIFRNIRGVREQLNEITAFIDGSQVYGSDNELAEFLRTLDGTGRLRTSEGNLLPVDEDGFFIAGDIRVNEQVGLIAMHTVFMREHNYWARKIGALLKLSDKKKGKKKLTAQEKKARGEKIYQLARTIVIAEIQQVTYDEFLPVVVGPNFQVNVGRNPSPSIANEFSTAAFRFGHSMLSPTLMMLDRRGRDIGKLALKDAFFNPGIIKEAGIAPVLRGLANQHAQEVDTMLVDGVRNFLFGPPGAGGFDLASLNIQRGRDHGLPSYNEVRKALDFNVADDFDEITGVTEDTPPTDPAFVTAVGLWMAYGEDNVDRVDLWAGGLAEPPAKNALVGETFQYIIADQFERTRAADKFWHEKQLKRYPILRRWIKKTKLSTIIKRNTNIGRELQRDAFMVTEERYRHKKRRWKDDFFPGEAP